MFCSSGHVNVLTASPTSASWLPCPSQSHTILPCHPQLLCSLSLECLPHWHGLCYTSDCPDCLQTKKKKEIELILLVNMQCWSMWLASCACVVYFSSLLLILKTLRCLKRKDDNWNRILLCDESCASDVSRLELEPNHRLSCEFVLCS